MQLDREHSLYFFQRMVSMVMDIAAEKHLGKEFELDRNIIVFIVQIFNS